MRPKNSFLLPSLLLLLLLALPSRQTSTPAVQTYPPDIQVRMVAILAPGLTNTIGNTYTLTFSGGFILNTYACTATVPVL